MAVITVEKQHVTEFLGRLVADGIAAGISPKDDSTDIFVDPTRHERAKKILDEIKKGK